MVKGGRELKMTSRARCTAYAGRIRDKRRENGGLAFFREVKSESTVFMHGFHAWFFKLK